MRTISVIFRGGILALGLSVAAFIGLNLLWRPGLNPAVTAALVEPPSRVAKSDNLYLAILALETSGTDALHERGAAILAAYLDPPLSVPWHGSFAEAAGLEPKPLRLGAEEICSLRSDQRTPDCLARSVAQRAALERALQQARFSLARYRALWDYPDFQNLVPMTLWAPLPPYQTMLEAKRLLHGEIALRLAAGEVTGSLQMLLRDTQMWRRILGSPELRLIDKMVANNALTGSWLLASEIIRQLELSPGDLELMARVLAPLSTTERDMAQAIATEFRLGAQQLELLEADPWKGLSGARGPGVLAKVSDALGEFGGIVYNRNASINALFEQFEDANQRNSQPCAQVQARWLAGHVSTQTPAQKLLPRLPLGLNPAELWYNPVGNFIVNLAKPDYSEFALRMCNTLGLNRVVSMQLRLRREGVARGHIASAVREAELWDPIADKPLKYDPQAHTLTFTPAGSQASLPLPL